MQDVDGVEGQLHEKRPLGVVLLQLPDCLVGEQIGRVTLHSRRLAIALPIDDAALVRVLEAINLRAKKPVEMVEPALQRRDGLAEMPFTGQ